MLLHEQHDIAADIAGKTSGPWDSATPAASIQAANPAKCGLRADLRRIFRRSQRF